MTLNNEIIGKKRNMLTIGTDNKKLSDTEKVKP